MFNKALEKEDLIVQKLYKECFWVGMLKKNGAQVTQPLNCLVDRLGKGT